MQNLLGAFNSSQPLPPFLRSYGLDNSRTFSDQVLAERDASVKSKLTSRAWRDVDKAPFTKAFNFIKPKSYKIKFELNALFREELLNFHAPKQLHSAVQELKKKLALKSCDKTPCEVQTPSLQPLLYATLSGYGVHRGAADLLR